MPTGDSLELDSTSSEEEICNNAPIANTFSLIRFTYVIHIHQAKHMAKFMDKTPMPSKALVS